MMIVFKDSTRRVTFSEVPRPVPTTSDSIHSVRAAADIVPISQLQQPRSQRQRSGQLLHRPWLGPRAPRLLPRGLAHAPRFLEGGLEENLSACYKYSSSAPSLSLASGAVGSFPPLGWKTRGARLQIRTQQRASTEPELPLKLGGPVEA